jgi:hypothetical protein
MTTPCCNSSVVLSISLQTEHQPHSNATARTAVSNIVILEVYVPGGSIKYLFTLG